MRLDDSSVGASRAARRSGWLSENHEDSIACRTLRRRRGEAGLLVERDQSRLHLLSTHDPWSAVRAQRSPFPVTFLCLPRTAPRIQKDPRIGLRGFHAVKALKHEYAWAIDLQICVFPQEGLTNDPGADPLLVGARG